MRKPQIEEMMKSLYYLHSIGSISWEKLKFNLEDIYDVYNIVVETNKMVCFQRGNKLRGVTITKINI